MTGLAQREAANGLGYRVHGRGSEHVLAFHDWMGDAANYESMKPYLDPSAYTYVFADVRGYGTSRHLGGPYTVDATAADAWQLADRLGWDRFHVIGHSMTGMVVQRMAVDDCAGGSRRLKSVVAVTPVSADGYPADDGTRQFLWDLIHQRELSEQGFGLLTGQRHSLMWARAKTDRHLETSSAEVLKGYYDMWLSTDFSADVRDAHVDVPLLVVGGRQDLPGFQEEHLRRTFGAWYANATFAFITDAGHYPMQETPVYLASLLDGFFARHSTP